MLTKIADYITKSKIGKQNAARQKHFLNWNNIKSIALLLESDLTLNKSALDKFIEETNKHLEIYYVEINSKQASYGDWKCLIKKDKTILGLPKNLFLEEVKPKNYDLVINISSSYQSFSANVVSHINSPFKCGNNNLCGELDLIIEKKESQNLNSYLKEVVKYLEMIKTG